eukprot:26934-Chlamydomonas_euryale.AAC.1
MCIGDSIYIYIWNDGKMVRNDGVCEGAKGRRGQFKTTLKSKRQCGQFRTTLKSKGQCGQLRRP